MVSGVTGEEFKADIFCGLVYYQRLRHMVSDKFQVRSVGQISPLTHQPIKGRKVGGGIRFGLERLGRERRAAAQARGTDAGQAVREVDRAVARARDALHAQLLEAEREREKETEENDLETIQRLLPYHPRNCARILAAVADFRSSHGAPPRASGGHRDGTN